MDFLFPLLILALLVPMFFGIRKQKREAEKVTSMQEALKVGDQVVTTSGLYGTVVELDDTTVDLEIAEDVVTTWLRQAIREVRAEESTVEETTVAADAAVEESAEQTETRLTKD
ncbi:preprotein translocase subunit YajC [Nocardia asteroides NBRC 15531]|uniref:Protein-export membrane protein YajC n=1 Tax=Nocardia asteroides NBRC 15531 TaxID=1110697 RepID=U5EB20_NOCAS|nr:preprotein translocase subunit YajC [Nocardia asteroides]TLF64402.1 preprotein translocase subunit YajC [Nocardia asteroides NBRC 15531]UGT50489.1 preprotein translocase subunit YajC [Nocardia asteroides]SFN36601.1 preprotein translocase subunit YajC [Nocardia asteroides]VEG36703.1 preprotein translocase subunit YajC [Nocardia asteroides]GAD84555.1 protein-export membrane protein YajC [Nocardia asteroides NBRC 15531]